jgi:hypothetical protein
MSDPYVPRAAAALVVLLLALVLSPVSGEELPEPGIKVEGALGSEVVERELRGEAETFPEGGRVYYLTRVSGALPGGRLLHVWYHGGEERATVELTLGGEAWRTWSYKTMHPGSKGAWRVEAVDEEGRTLHSVEFTCE